MDDSYFSLFPNIKITNGYKQSLLVDLYLGQYKSIPKILSEVLTYCESFKISIVKQLYKNEINEGIDTYLNFLKREGLGFFTKTKNMCPSLNEEWDSPSLITNIIIDISNENIEMLLSGSMSLLEDIDSFMCMHAEVRVYDINLNKAKLVLEFLNLIESSFINSLILYTPINLFNDCIKDYIYKSNKVDVAIIHSASKVVAKEDVISYRGKKIIFTNKAIDSHAHCGEILQSFFAVNINAYTEGLLHNSCLNRKISIDANGYIKNCPSMIENYGHISKMKLSDVYAQTELKNKWKISKSNIKTCSDCEYRDICSDCRAYLTDPSDMYSKPLKCGYDPYQGTWTEWTKNPLNKKVIEYYKIS